ncbi:hypothetical protein [Burkholderia aenigmatica]|uniref:hypothetical protein n=1 Tax=Burkholderia aenigmatica TaxID=2015348 RepID=UPI00158447B9|nr:hypothetical protein [Burkholderia aenigmatica]
MNCKPGDLAIITGCFYKISETNIGAIVRILEPALHTKAPHAWSVLSTRALMSQSGETVWKIVVADCHLRPVSGLPVTEDITDEVTA